MAWIGILSSRDVIRKGMRWIFPCPLFNNCWEKDRLSQVLDRDTVSKIRLIPIPICNKSYYFVWEHSSNEIFLIKSATWIQGRKICLAIYSR